MNSKELADLRRDFSSEELSESSVAADPLEQFGAWMKEALTAAMLDANAMTLSTVGADGRPSARVVLLKGFGPEGFTFFTNYESRKGRELAANPNAFMHFFWPELERQVSIAGTVEKISREESESYFVTRPLESRIGAWASNQSTILESRKELENRVRKYIEKFHGDVPLPPHWGGFRLTPESFEFWQGRASRLHDRICYERHNGIWEIVRRSP